MDGWMDEWLSFLARSCELRPNWAASLLTNPATSVPFILLWPVSQLALLQLLQLLQLLRSSLRVAVTMRLATSSCNPCRKVALWSRLTSRRADDTIRLAAPAAITLTRSVAASLIFFYAQPCQSLVTAGCKAWPERPVFTHCWCWVKFFFGVFVVKRISPCSMVHVLPTSFCKSGTWQLCPKTVYCWGAQCSLEGCPLLSKCLLDVSLHLSPGLAGGVRLLGCLSSLVSLLAGGVWIFGWPFVFNCFPSGWCLPAFSLRYMPFFICFTVCIILSDVALHLSPFMCVSQACACLPPFVCQSGWWCPALRMSRLTWFSSCIARFADVFLYLSVCVCLPEWRVVSGSASIPFFLSCFFFLSVCGRNLALPNPTN